jgi:hypothetical protein
MEPKGSSPCSQQLPSEHNSEPDEFNLHSRTLFL